MKKLSVLFISFLFALLIGLSSCNGCNGNQGVDEVKTDSVELVSQKANLNLEHLVSTDRQQMFLQYNNNYRWFESCIVLQDWLDAEQSENAPVITAVSNVFQYVIEYEEQKSFDTYVVLFAHTPDTAAVEVKANAFWVGDQPLDESEIKLTFAQAYEKLMEANIVKPHSQKVVLRRELGPINANAQYIFGNTHEHVYVDAVTGDVRTNNPCFPEEQGFKMPLGEWP